MNSEELTDRLIEDLSKSIAIRNSVPDVITQINLTAIGHNDLTEFMSALNVTTFDNHLNYIAQFLNFGGERLISHETGSEVNAVQFLEDVVSKKQKVVERIQFFNDNETIVDVVTGQPVSEMLIEQLEWLHQYAR